MKDIFSDPAMRALVAAVMVSDAPEDLRVPSVAAAWAVDGVLGIVPAAVAAGRAEEDRPNASTDDTDDIKRHYQERKQQLEDEFEEQLETMRTAAIAAERKARVEKELNRTADGFLKAIRQLEADPAQTEQDLAAKIEEIREWLRKQRAAEAASGKTEQSAVQAEAATSGGKKSTTTSTA